MEQDFDLTNFTAGELSPRMKGRVDYEKYFDGCAAALNMVVMPQGGMTRRPGTMYVTNNFDQAHPPRLRRFQFNTEQSYMLEFGAGYVRFLRDDGLVINPQVINNATNNGAGLIRLTLVSAAGIYTGNVILVTGCTGTVEANGTWYVSNVPLNLSVSGAVNNGNGTVRLTVSSTANLINGASVTISGIVGTIEANGTWPILIVDGTHIDLQSSVFVNTYTSGGTLAAVDAFNIDLQGTAFVHAYTGGGIGTVAVQVPTPYGTADLQALYFTQSDDTLYICHPNYPVATLARSSNVQWAYQPLNFRDGPYLDLNSTTTTITISNAGSSGGGGVQFHATGLLGGWRTIATHPGDQSRSVTLSASSTLGINATPQNVGQGFLSTDVGRAIRIKQSSAWVWMIITSVISNLQVTAVIQPYVYGGAWGDLDFVNRKPDTYYPVGVVVENSSQGWRCIQDGISSNGAGPTGGSLTMPEVQDGDIVWEWLTQGTGTVTTFWQLGKWTVGVYPYAVTFWQQRLMFLGSNLQPNAIEASVTGDFTNMAPTAQDGTVIATNALSFIISDDQVNQIQWVKAAGAAQAAQLAIGTVGTEHIMQAYATSEALTPANVQVYPETTNGSAPVEPVRIGKSLLFVDRPGRKLLEWTFLWQVNGYDTIELTKYSEHITQSGVTALQYALAPHRLVWLLLANGSLVSCSYSKNEQVFGPSRHQLGGDYYGGPPIIESMDIIPSQDTSFDQVWLAVLRTINGVPTRTIEVMTPWFEQATIPQENAIFLDCSISTTLPTPGAKLTVSGLTLAPALAGQAPQYVGTATLVADTAGAFAGHNPGDIIRVNGGSIQIATLTNSQNGTGVVQRPLTSLAPAASGTWSCAHVYSTFSQLSYLNGETVGVLGDGADFGTAVVSGGSINIPAPGASMVTVGLPYTSTVVTMPYEPQRAAAAASQGKVKRIDTVWLRLHESLGCSYGARMTDDQTFFVRDVVENLETRSAAMMMGQAPTLFSGVRQLRLPGGYSREGQMIVTTASPLPLTVLSIFARADVADMPGQGR